MNTKVAKKRKNIDLEEQVISTLNIMAATQNTNIKNLIESILTNIADDFEDELLFLKTIRNNPESWKPVSKEEKEDFLNFLGIKEKVSHES